MSETRHRVFVYGTLRSGGSNHHRMAGAVRIASAAVRGRLYRIDWYPGVVLDPEAGEVRGEIYEVSDLQFAALNEYEGDEYRCVEVEAQGYQPPDETFYAKMWEWKGSPDPERKISHGDWLVASRRIYPVFVVLGWLLLFLNIPGLIWICSSDDGLSRLQRIALYIGVFLLPWWAAPCGWLSTHRHESGPRWARLLSPVSVVLVFVNILIIARFLPV